MQVTESVKGKRTLRYNGDNEEVLPPLGRREQRGEVGITKI